MNTSAIMRILYGTETPRCSLCSKTLLTLDESRTAVHPLNPIRSLAYCAPCWNAKSGKREIQKSESPLSIRVPPEMVDCETCGRAIRIESHMREEDKKHIRFCSIACYTDKANGLDDGKKGLRRVRSYKSAGACDCEDYHMSGYCTMTFQAGSP